MRRPTSALRWIALQLCLLAAVCAPAPAAVDERLPPAFSLSGTRQNCSTPNLADLVSAKEDGDGGRFLGLCEALALLPC